MRGANLSLPLFRGAVQTYRRLWGLYDRNATLFFFYVDSGPKNLRFSADGVLKMFDFDSPRWVLANSLCSAPRHCASGNKAVKSCLQGRCQAERMAATNTYHCQGWLADLIRSPPREVKMHPAVVRLRHKAPHFSRAELGRLLDVLGGGDRPAADTESAGGLQGQG